MNTTDLVKVLEGEKKALRHYSVGGNPTDNSRANIWNAAIDRAIEIVETHGKK